MLTISPLDLQEAAAMRLVGALAPSDLPEVAALLLERGLDSPGLRRLAALEPSSWDGEAWLRRAMQELQVVEFSSRLEAAQWYVERLARHIAVGRVQPAVGARAIW